MKDFSVDLDVLKFMVDENMDAKIIIIHFIKHLQLEEEFTAQAQKFHDFILETHLQNMANQSNPVTKQAKLDKIELFRIEKYDFIYGSGQSNDKKVSFAFFMFEQPGKGNFSCANLQSQTAIFGPFTFTRDRNDPFQNFNEN